IVRDAGWSILQPELRRLVGIARWRPTKAPLGIGWLARPVVDVFEAEDEPLVFSVRRLWGLSPRWEVADADGQCVAILKRGCILDTYGQTWSTWEQTPNEVRFRGVDREFAQVRKSTDGIRLVFASEV